MSKWYEYRFEDGYICVVMGMDKIELKHEIAKHGKLINKREFN